ncbi:hypothetical protein, partial [Bellilinea sp.]|uniref:hypothetical protein n=1 Tax=Bellilinea sp. TaxID=2838785 RepID=UPI002ADD77DF
QSGRLPSALVSVTSFGVTLILVCVAALGGTLLDKVNKKIDRQDAKVSFSPLCAFGLNSVASASG